MARRKGIGSGGCGYVLLALLAVAYHVGWETILAVAVVGMGLLFLFFYFREREREKRLLGWSLNELDRVSGRQFEDWVVAVLEANGISARHVGRSGDYGLDVIASVDSTKFGIQVKRHSSNVGNRAVQEAIAGASYYDCSVPVVVTQSRFTPAARKQAQAATPRVLLIGRSELPRLADVLRSAALQS